jgi:hypothetical protein
LARPNKFDQQRPADVERLVHVGVHGGVLVHGPPGDVAQHHAQAAGSQDEERHDQHADQRQPPLEGQHDGQDGDRLDDVGDDADDGVADGVLRADHVIVQPGHQLADLGVGEEAQRHALQARKERHAQVVDHALAHRRVQPPLDHVDPAGDERHEQKRQRKEQQAVQVFGRQDRVDQMPENQGGNQRESRGEQDRHQHPADVIPVRTRVSQHAQKSSLVTFGLVIARTNNCANHRRGTCIVSWSLSLKCLKVLPI